MKAVVRAKTDVVSASSVPVAHSWEWQKQVLQWHPKEAAVNSKEPSAAWDKCRITSADLCCKVCLQWWKHNLWDNNISLYLHFQGILLYFTLVLFFVYMLTHWLSHRWKLGNNENRVILYIPHCWVLHVRLRYFKGQVQMWLQTIAYMLQMWWDMTLVPTK